MSPVGAIFVPFPPKSGTNMLHPLSPPIVELENKLIYKVALTAKKSLGTMNNAEVQG